MQTDTFNITGRVPRLRSDMLHDGVHAEQFGGSLSWLTELTVLADQTVHDLRQRFLTFVDGLAVGGGRLSTLLSELRVDYLSALSDDLATILKNAGRHPAATVVAIGEGEVEPGVGPWADKWRLVHEIDAGGKDSAEWTAFNGRAEFALAGGAKRTPRNSDSSLGEVEASPRGPGSEADVIREFRALFAGMSTSDQLLHLEELTRTVNSESKPSGK